MIGVTEGDGRDVAAIMPVMSAAFDASYGEAWTASQCLSLLTMPGSTLFLARIDNDLAGFALTRWVADEEELLLIAVHPDWQCSGIASALIENIKATARNAGRRTIFLEVRANNSAFHFYCRNGFEQIGVRPGYYLGANGARYDAISMKFQI